MMLVPSRHCLVLVMTKHVESVFINEIISFMFVNGGEQNIRNTSKICCKATLDCIRLHRRT